MKTIIFDFGGVFNLNDSVREFWQKNSKVFDIDFEIANQLTLDIWTKARLGEGDSSLFWTEAAKLTHLNVEEYKRHFFEFTGWRGDLYEFVKKELKGKYKLGMISNQIEAWLEPILEERGFRDIFDVIVTSYGVGIAKPDVGIYQKAIQELGADPKDCIYIDDREKNLEPARRLGMETILFKDTESFKKELNKLLV